MKKDILRWDAKYQDREATADIQPDATLKSNLNLFDGKGNALDLAAGTCDNALYLAASGYRATAIDGSRNALRLGLQKAEANGSHSTCKALKLIGTAKSQANPDRYSKI